MKAGACYWRFKGGKAFVYGYASRVSGGLYRMGLYNGDYDHGPIVDPSEIEYRPIWTKEA